LHIIPKVMPPIFLRWPTTLEADASSKGAVWQNGIWHVIAYLAEVWHWIPPCRKKLHALTYTNAWWKFTETKEWMWAQEGGGWCVLAVATVMWETGYIPGSTAELSAHEMKSPSISSSAKIGRLQPGNFVWSWTLAHISRVRPEKNRTTNILQIYIYTVYSRI
jgi:hypothetical protein